MSNMLRIKWVGEPTMTFEDGFSVANWEHENRRSVATVGFAYLSAKRENFPGLSRDYMWGRPRKKAKDGTWVWGKAQQATWEDFIQDVDPLDWEILQTSEKLRLQLKDVTGHPNPVEVLKDKIVIKKDAKTGQYARVLHRS